jgi:hypothetical protein
MKLLAEIGGLTQAEIARWVGLRSGSAVSHSIKKMDQQLETNKIQFNRYNKLKLMF